MPEADGEPGKLGLGLELKLVLGDTDAMAGGIELLSRIDCFHMHHPS